MKALLFFIGALLFSITSHAFLKENIFYTCEGTLNSFRFDIAQELKDANGDALSPRHFAGTYNITGEQEKTELVFVIENNKMVSMHTLAGSEWVGSLEKFAVVSFSKITESGAKQVTLCKLFGDD